MRLFTFGRLAVTAEDGETEVRLQRRQLVLLALVAAESPGGIARDRALGLLAADREQDRARHTLDQTLYAIRRSLGADTVVSGPIALQIDGARLTSDVREFTAALARGDDATAAALYAGPFLDGVFVTEAPEFERWVDARRAHFATAFVQALSRLAASATARGDHAGAVAYLRRAAATEPLSSAITQALMLALAHAGDVSTALAAARVHRTLVREQLEADADPRVAALEESLRIGCTPLPVGPVGPAPAERAPAVRLDQSGQGGALPAPSVPSAHRRRGTGGLLSLPAAITAGMLVVTIVVGGLTRPRSGYVLRDQTQLTTNGGGHTPSISADGRYLAYAARDCASSHPCTYAVEIVEIGRTATRRILEGASLIDFLGWSPDGRNLLVAGSIGGEDGIFLVSALGGAPRFLTPRFANFFSGGDSLLFLAPQRDDSVRWLEVAGLDGAPRDSIPVASPGRGGLIDEVLSVPGSPWLLLLTRFRDRGEMRVLDRQGRIASRLSFTDAGRNVRTSGAAAWLSLPQGENSVLVRIPLDVRSGRLSPVYDTVFSGVFTDFDVSMSGDRLVLAQELLAADLFALDFQDLLRGHFAPVNRLVSSSMNLDGALSPDGATILLARELGTVPGGGYRLSLVPFPGGTERPLSPRDAQARAGWASPHELAIEEGIGDTMRLALVDATTGARSDELSVAHEVPRYFAHLPGGGWVWITADGQALSVRKPGSRAARIYPRPAWTPALLQVSVSADGSHVAFWGGNLAEDSACVFVMSLEEGSPVPWWTIPAPRDLSADWFPDGSLRVRTHRADHTVAFTRLASPGRAQPLGVSARPVGSVEVSTDMRRAMLITRETRGDIWMSRVVRR